jgi:hypothetical protein
MGCGQLVPTAFSLAGGQKSFAAALIRAVGCVQAPGPFCLQQGKEEYMFNVKCFHCGKSFAVDEDLAAAWLEEHKDEHPRHYPAQCHFCRRVIKVPVQQIQRHPPVQET